MLRSYLKIALRQLSLRPTLGLLTIAGLSVGMAVYWLLYSYVWHELHYDQATPQLYRLTQSAENNAPWLRDHPVVSRSIASAVAGIEQVTRLKPASGLVRSNWTASNESRLFFADPTLFSTFGVTLQEGSVASFSNDPATVVLTRSAARKYFGNRSALNQRLQIYGDDGLATLTLRVVGVMADWPSTTHVHADFLIPYREGVASQDDMGVYAYLLLHPTVVPEAIERQINALNQVHARAWKTEPKVHFQLQPVGSIHLHSHFGDELEVNGNLQTVYVLALMGLLVVLMACINYVNLTLAQSTDRVREIGMRKVLGSSRRLILYQFLTESAISLLIAVGVALLLAHLSLPFVTQFLGKDIRQPLPTQLVIGLPLLLVIGLAVSAYPAVVLANYRPIHALKAISPLRFLRGNRLREGLTVIQFALAVVLLISTLVMYRQLVYIQRRPLGFNQEQIVAIRLRNEAAQRRLSVLSQQLRQVSGVNSVAASHTIPGDAFDSLPCEMPAESSVNGFGQEGFAANVLFMDPGYFDLMKFRLVAGRAFDKRNEQADSRYALLINETAVREYGWQEPRKALGQTIGVWNRTRRQIEPLVVVGVVGDFHYQSLHERVQPVLLKLTDGSSPYGYAGSLGVLSVKIAPHGLAETIASLEKGWKRIHPDQPFEFSFVDQRVAQLYQNDRQEGQLMLIFAGVAILITCFGLFSMAAFNVAKRTKEIGVRKVLGASLASIVALLSKDFLKLVVLAIVVACPLAGYAMHRWLQNFAYKIALEWWVFALAGLLAVGIALLTVSFQSIKAALMNPVKSLRTD